MFTKCFDVGPVWLERPFFCGYPNGGDYTWELGYRTCKVSVGDMDSLADLMILEMLDLNIILGMDWLESWHATLDCRNKMIKFGMPDEPAFAIQGDKIEAPNNLISALGGRRFWEKGVPDS